MILIFEPTPFARSKSLANGVGLFYKAFFIFLSAAARTVNHFFAYVGDEPYVHRIGAVKKVPKKKGCDLAKKQDSSLFLWYN